MTGAEEAVIAAIMKKLPTDTIQSPGDNMPRRGTITKIQR